MQSRIEFIRINSFGFWLTMVFAVPMTAAEPVPAPEDEPHFQYLFTRLKEMTVQLETGPAELSSKPLFRWQNPVSGADGAVFLWTSQGRPVILAKTHLNDQKQHYIETWAMLTSKPFTVRRGGASYWAPEKSDVQPRKIGDVDAPAGAAGVRLTQMRAIARRYRFTSFWGEENRSEWELRLLSTPLHRYSSSDTGVIDGAIFGYAQGTNPEAVLVVEAISSSQGNYWEAYPVRLSGYAIKAWLDEQQVLDVPYLQNTPSNLPYYKRYEQLRPYPFPMDAKSKSAAVQP